MRQSFYITKSNMEQCVCVGGGGGGGGARGCARDTATATICILRP